MVWVMVLAQTTIMSEGYDRVVEGSNPSIVTGGFDSHHKLLDAPSPQKLGASSVLLEVFYA